MARPSRQNKQYQSLCPRKTINERKVGNDDDYDEMNNDNNDNDDDYNEMNNDNNDDDDDDDDDDVIRHKSVVM